MSTDPQSARRQLPDRPNLRHLKDQATFDTTSASGRGNHSAGRFFENSISLTPIEKSVQTCSSAFRWPV